jgi:YidC/Oxa1 family membrane protein insertase
MMIWQQWQLDYGPQTVQEASLAYEGNQAEPVSVNVEKTSANSAIPDAPAIASNDLPESQNQVAVGNEAINADPVATQKKIQVETDTLSLIIDTRGGSIIKVNLKNYPLSLDRPDTQFPLLTELPANYYIAQSGLIAADKALAPTHEAIYSSSAES